MKTLKETFQDRFNKLYEGKRLLAIHLDGFSHSVIFDNGSKENEIEHESYSGCAPELYDQNSRVAKLFTGIAHFCYQNNAEEICYVLPQER